MNTDDNPRRVRVGDATVPVSETEWFLANLPPNTPIEWDGHREVTFGSISRVSSDGPGVGILLYTWFYDGVVAEVDCGGRRVTLHPATDRQLQVRVLEDTARLNLPGTHGDGI